MYRNCVIIKDQEKKKNTSILDHSFGEAKMRSNKF